MIAVGLVALRRDLPPATIHAAIAGAIARAAEPRDLASAIAAMVRDSSDEAIVALVGSELLRRLASLDDARTPLASTWEQACDAARAEAAQARREAGEAVQALANARLDAECLSHALQIARADRDALFALGWRAIVERDELRRLVSDMSAGWAVDTRRADRAENARDRARSIGRARTRRLIAALRAAARSGVISDRSIADLTAPATDVPTPPGAGAFASVFSAAPAPPSSSSRRAPAPPSVAAIPGPPSSRPDVAPVALLVAERREQREPAPGPRPAALALPVLAPLVKTTPTRPAFHLTVLPISELTEHAQHFACAPLRATITASTCLSRQRAADPIARKLLSPGDRMATGGAGAYGACKTCPDGKRIEQQLSGTPTRKPRRQAPTLTAGASK